MLAEPSAAERALFRQAVADVTPLINDKVHHEPAAAPPMRRPRHLDPSRELPRLGAPLGAVSLDTLLAAGEEARFLRSGLPRTLFKDLRRGRWPAQDECDLHGLNRDQAMHLLERFLAASLVGGLRCVRIVHGKGWRSPGREPVLKNLTRHWLANRPEVLAYCQARAAEGGEGAVIVLLKAAA